MEKKLAGIVIGFIVLSLVFAVIERKWPANKNQKIFRSGYKTDLFYWLFTPLFSQPFALLVTGTVLAIVMHAKTKEQLIQAALHRDTWMAHQPLWLQFVLMLLIGDIVSYWTHRMFHGRKLWKYHAVHHSPEELDWLSSVRLHPVNEALGRLIVALVLVGIGFDFKAIVGFLPVFTFYAIALHANVNWDFGWLGNIIASPRFHRWHHTSQEEGLDKNFAGLFPWIDRIFGTYYMPKDRLPEKFGLYGEDFPQGFWGQLMYPFKKRKKKAVAQ